MNDGRTEFTLDNIKAAYQALNLAPIFGTYYCPPTIKSSTGYACPIGALVINKLGDDWNIDTWISEQIGPVLYISDANVRAFIMGYENTVDKRLEENPYFQLGREARDWAYSLIEG